MSCWGDKKLDSRRGSCKRTAERPDAIQLDQEGPLMKLLDEIVDLASNNECSAAILLRKTLVLAHTLKSVRLQVWAEHELYGYKTANDDEIPEYRKTAATAKGLFIGPFGAQINNQPIPPGALRQEHRCFAESRVLGQPIAACEQVGADSSLFFDWPANLTVLYQSAFFQHRYHLNRAWQEVPGTVFVGLIYTVKPRVLRFALELRDDLGLVSDEVKDLPKEKVDQQVTKIIFGGTTVIASNNFTQNHSIQIDRGDWVALSDALSNRLGIDAPAIADLKTALDQDSDGEPMPGLGKRAADWLKQFGKKTGSAAVSFGVEVAKKEATTWILQFLGHLGQ